MGVRSAYTHPYPTIITEVLYKYDKNYQSHLILCD